MRLGKVQAAGYIEDIEANAAGDAEEPRQAERSLLTPDSAPAAVPVVAAG